MIRPTLLQATMMSAALLCNHAIWAATPAKPAAKIVPAPIQTSTPPVALVEMKPSVVKTAAELEQAVAAAKPGATIILADGSYTDFQAKLVGKGEENKPVTIRAQTPGQAILTGESGISIDGEWLVLSGVVFKDGNPKPPTDPTDFNASAINIMGKHNRVTEIAIIDYSKNYRSPPGTDKNKEGFHKWLTLDGQYNRVDHSLFKGKKGGGTLFTVIRTIPDPNFHQIDHNAFIDVEYGFDQNGWETIRLGDSKYSQFDSKTIVEHNYFERCDGEVEIISNKSGGNIYRFNTIKDSRGALTLRHGPGVTVENNAILQSGLKGIKNIQTAGIRVSDKNHIIRNNYIEGVSAYDDATGGIAFLAHNNNPPLNDYWKVENILIENNSLINSSNTLVIGASRGRQAPGTLTLNNNVFCSNLGGNKDTGALVYIRPKNGSTELKLSGNTFCADKLGVDPAQLGDSTFSNEGIKQVNGLWIADDAKKGYRPVKITTRADAGPRTFQP